MTNNGATDSAVLEQVGVHSAEFYLLSGVPLSICLIGSAIVPRAATRLVNSRAFMFAMGLIASLGTWLLATGGFSFDDGAARFLFGICGVLTGVGTAFICLRVGSIYSAPPADSAPFFTIVKAMLTANLLFFMCVSLPDPVSNAALSLLPVLAAISSMVGGREAGGEKDESDLVSIASLPRGFVPRLLLAVFVISVVVGVAKGLSALLQTHADIQMQAIIAVFASFVILGTTMLVMGLVLSRRNYEISKIYFPLIVCACFIILLCSFLDGSVGAFQNIAINVGYNLVIVAVWALFSDLAERTTISPVRMFGFGRGASGLGTTIGWFVAYCVMKVGTDPISFLAPFFLVAVVVVLVAVLLVLGQQTVSEALDCMLKGLARPGKSGEDGKESVADPFELWERGCAQLASECQLTARETEVLKLLSRGRTAGYIALELGISQNTVKGHTRNVYAKVGVHSRQEVIDRLEAIISGAPTERSR
ncbi:MAG: helix-turn-helix transcriptional regulator [Eggerthellaceae bacterium]|nr:helix-turn-helix transcriptional regulator [Eggerthellaceae bacterium]